MKVTLLKDRQTPEAYYKAGETIEVSEAEYDWLMSVYLAERLELAKQDKTFKDKFEALKGTKGLK